MEDILVICLVTHFNGVPPSNDILYDGKHVSRHSHSAPLCQQTYTLEPETVLKRLHLTDLIAYALAGLEVADLQQPFVREY